MPIIKEVEKLCPRMPTVTWRIIAVSEKDIKEFDEEDIMKAAERIKSKKAPGSNGIPPEALKILANKNPQTIVKSANAVIKSGIFPTEWKVARLVLIEKAEKNKYRPICLLNSEFNMLEMLIKMRIEEEIEQNNSLYENQYGFRTGRGTLDAIAKIKEIQAESKRRRENCVMITLNIENAFNTAPWDKIRERVCTGTISEHI
nr:unnamed protein product [Callosobruchus analis]